MPSTDTKKASTQQDVEPQLDPVDGFEADLEAEETALEETIGDEIGDDAGEQYEATTEDVDNEDDVSFEDDDLDDDGLGYGDEEEDGNALN